MGKWLNRLRNASNGIPTKPTKPSSVSSVSAPSDSFQEKAPGELVASAAKDQSPSSAWLHLLVLDDGSVIQRFGEQATVIVEQKARLRFGAHLQAVVAVPGYERTLTEEEVAKALAGTLGKPAALPPPSNAWLIRVASLLGTRPAELLDGGHLESHDLVELAGSDPAQVAKTIRSSPAWINRPRLLALGLG